MSNYIKNLTLKKKKSNSFLGKEFVVRFDVTRVINYSTLALFSKDERWYELALQLLTSSSSSSSCSWPEGRIKCANRIGADGMEMGRKDGPARRCLASPTSSYPVLGIACCCPFAQVEYHLTFIRSLVMAILYSARLVPLIQRTHTHAEIYIFFFVWKNK